ncbi:MAG: pantoate--beta-alanine ligase [Deltaproteobacteria bacterium]|nr:pantoate--beta-alanine ligase [Deltaproteobacteria bacterium]
MKIVKSVSGMQEASRQARSEGKKIVLVPTMGFLHQGHKRLLDIGRHSGGLLVLSIFVNPTQFGPKEDLSSYPRDFDRDCAIAKSAGVDIIFAPEPEDVYPKGFDTFIEVAGLSNRLCGLSRPGHFRGVATVVLKLFNMVMPDKAIFGKKDYQQLAIIRKMAKDLDLSLEIIGVDTVREADGLAMSSRNSYLSTEERSEAKCIPESIEEAKKEFSKGVRQSSLIIEKVKKIIEKQPLAVIDYIKVCDKDSLEDLSIIEDSAQLFLAVKIGKARLIDNCLLAAE